MSHTKYHTESLILGGVDTGEADRFIQMLTRDFGLLGVHARGIRKMSSKQRPYLQNLSFPKVSLVRGRNIWRLVHVENSKDSPIGVLGVRDRALLSRIAMILKRFIRGEEFNPALFDAVKQGVFAARSREYDHQEAQDLENVIVLRILYFLGYVSKEGMERRLFDEPHSYSADVIRLATESREIIDSQIYLAIEESGL